jgi:hypothetical protein
MPEKLFYAPFRLQELEAAYYQLKTTAAPLTISNGEGGFYMATVDDLPSIKKDIETLRYASTLTHYQ